MTNPYWLRLRGTGLKSKDWDTGRIFGGANFQKGVEVYVGTQQGAVVLKVFADDQAQVRARVSTAQHRFPPGSGRLIGISQIIREIFIKDPTRGISQDEQLSLFGIGSDVCRSCGAEIHFVETESGGRMTPLNRETKKGMIVNRDGKAEVVDVYTSHFATCPDAEDWRR